MRGVAGKSRNPVQLPLLLTAALHLGALLLALVGPRLIPEQPRTPEVYQVDLYTAPEVAPAPPVLPTKVEIPSPPAAPPPPATVPPKTDSRPVAHPAPPTQPRSKAISLSPLKERLARENREREEEARRRQVGKIKLGLQEGQAQQQVREAARQAREAIAETYRITPVRPAQELPEKIATLREELAAGAPASPASYSPTPAQLAARDAYIARLKEHLRRHWTLPDLQDWDEKLSATMVIRIKREGTVTATWFEKGSGNSRFDRYVKMAVTNAAPLPPLPQEFAQKSEEIGVTFTPGGLK